MTWRRAAAFALIMLSLAAPLAATAQGYPSHGWGYGDGYVEHGRHGGPGGLGGRPAEYRGFGPGLGGGGPRGRGWTRGQYLPPMARGEVIRDFQRRHLRRPPRGYYWYRAGDDYVLAAIATGVIFEVIPGDGY